MPTMNGGGETGEECMAVASGARQLLTWLFVATSTSDISSPVASRTTRPSSKLSSFASHSSASAAMAHKRSFSCVHAFCTAMPVTYVVEEAYEPES